MNTRLICICLMILGGTFPVRSGDLWSARAKTAPTFPSIEALATYLTDGITDEKAQARVLADWVAYQVQRDGYRHKELIRYSHQNRQAPAPVPNDVFRTRIGTPADFADLYRRLGEAVGLTVRVIPGYAGRDIQAFRYQKPLYQAAEVLADTWLGSYHLQRYESTWNAVQTADGNWHLVDTYWMIANPDLFEGQNISSTRAMERFLARRKQHTPGAATLTRGKQIDDRYFFAKPIFFIRTHFPAEADWQLLPTPWTWSTFIHQ